MMPQIKLIECPRDAMQGWKQLIPAEKKIAYLNKLLHAGFDTIDFGSFVSAKAIPQMADTKQVLEALNMNSVKSKLLAIVANTRGAEEAVKYHQINYLGFPFSVSETFQQRNTNSSIAESFIRVGEIQNLCIKSGKQLVIYLSMGFGNPYHDPYSEEIVYNWANKMAAMEIKIISLADTVGLATANQVYQMTASLIQSLPQIEIGVHLHSTHQNRKEKLEAALKAGCIRIDGALMGIGGCPMANDELVGNMNMEWMISYMEEKGIKTGIDQQVLSESLSLASGIFV